MPIDRAAVDHVARLARLDLSEDERARMQTELGQILDYAEALQRIDLDGVEPTSHSIEIRNVLRPDEVTPSLDQDEVLAMAPAPEDGRFRVPRIIEDA
ncbi:MAG: Asp-tRNA(Asn)/Glu-tRNA(Gln) amidotransferase subunit GatC [Actinomycetota bacterium]|nr:Asp-tRNA(Asn)/Glu-tRNA(Gln) amidotransferase subunit GatC [Actinomycetota bacterium]